MKFLVSFFVFVLIALIIALPVMYLWNAVMPDVFGMIEINFLQALYISLLSSLLFKSNTSSKD